MRDLVRELHDAADLSFAEVHIATSLAECERRDVKGLYAKARAGELTGMTGIDDPYEAPVAPDVKVDETDGTALEMATLVIERLSAAGVLPS